MWGAAEGLGEQRSALSAGWRRRRYFVEAGYVQPIRGSQVEEYDPFSAYYGTDAFLAKRSLYLELVDLNLDDTAAIERFTSDWGLLGLLQHRLVQVTHRAGVFPAEDPAYAFPDIEETIEVPGAHPAEALLMEMPVSRYHARYLPGWGGPDEPSFSPPPAVKTALIEAGIATLQSDDEIVIRPGATEAEVQAVLDALHCREYKEWEATARNQFGFVLRRNGSGWVEEVGIEEHYTPFLPNVREWRETTVPRYQERPGETMAESSARALSAIAAWALDYPTLQSPALWDYLCEPLDQFRAAVQELRELYELCAYSLSHPVVPPPPDGRQNGPAWEAHGSDEEKRWKIRRLFTRELQNIHPLPVRDDEKGWTWRWSFPSLLSAAYAMMFLDYAVSRRRLRFCASETCGKSFVTERSDRRYCSESCQNTQKQREFRRAKKAADRPPKGEGM